MLDTMAANLQLGDELRHIWLCKGSSEEFFDYNLNFNIKFKSENEKDIETVTGESLSLKHMSNPEIKETETGLMQVEVVIEPIKQIVEQRISPESGNP